MAAMVDRPPEMNSLQLTVNLASTCGLVYVPTLDVVVVSTREGRALVYDAYSWKPLSNCHMTRVSTCCTYHEYTGKFVSTDGTFIGARKDLNGMLYLPSLLQPLCPNSEEVVFELPAQVARGYHKLFTEADYRKTGQATKEPLYKCLDKALEAGKQARENNPARERSCWDFVEIRGQLSALQSSISDLKQKLGDLSAVHSQLWSRSLLLDLEGNAEKMRSVEGGVAAADALMGIPVQWNSLEAFRQLSLITWPHAKHKWATPSSLAAAGFYSTFKQEVGGFAAAVDLVTCFKCQKSLRSWEPTDEPWSEHTRHFAACPYITRQCNTNVPLSVTMATTPAATLGTLGKGTVVLSTSWGCPYVGVAWQSGLIAVYNVGKCLHSHEVCPPILLSAKSLRESVRIGEVVSPSGDGGSNSLSQHSESRALEQALDGLKAAVADLPAQLEGEGREQLGPDRETTPTTVTATSCCLLGGGGGGGGQTTEDSSAAVVQPAVLVGCTVSAAQDRGQTALLVSHVLRPQDPPSPSSPPPSHPATSVLHRVTRVPFPAQLDQLTPVVKDIIPVCGGTFLVVNVLYSAHTPTGPPKEGTEEDEGFDSTCDATSEGGADESTSGGKEQQFVGNQVLVFSVQSAPLDGSSVTSISSKPVCSRAWCAPDHVITSLCAVEPLEASGGAARANLVLAGTTAAGSLLLLSGEDLSVVQSLEVPSPSGRSTRVVRCVPCAQRGQLLVQTSGNALQFVDLPTRPPPSSSSLGAGCCADTNPPPASEDFFDWCDKASSWLGSTSSVGVPYLSLAPPTWIEVSPAEQFRDSPDHIHREGEACMFRRAWMVGSSSTRSLEEEYSVLEVMKLARSDLGMLKVLLSSSSPALLEGASLSVFLRSEPSARGASSQQTGVGGLSLAENTKEEEHSASSLYEGTLPKDLNSDGLQSNTTEESCTQATGEDLLEETKEQRAEIKSSSNGPPIVTEVDQKPSFDSVLVDCPPGGVEWVRRTYQAELIAGPVRCGDVCGLAGGSACLPLYHPSLADHGCRRYLVLVQWSSAAASKQEGGAPKTHPQLFLSLSFLRQAAPLRRPPDLVALGVSTLRVQQLALTACELCVREEDRSSLPDPAHKWVESAEVRSTLLSDEIKLKAVQVLCTLAGRLVFAVDRSAQSELLRGLAPLLTTMIHQCLLFGSRQLSYRCLRLFTMCLRIDKLLLKDKESDPDGHDSDGRGTFSTRLHRALLANVELIPSARLAVGIRNLLNLVGEGAVGVEGKREAAEVLLSLLARLLDSVGSIHLIPALQGLLGAETSIMNLNYEQSLFDGGLPSLPCLSGDTGKPSLDYSTLNHNNEMDLFCHAHGPQQQQPSPPGDKAEGGGGGGALSFSDMRFPSAGGERDRRPVELICESMKMAPFLRQSQVGGLDSLELQYTFKSFTTSLVRNAPSMKISPRQALLPFSAPPPPGAFLIHNTLQPRASLQASSSSSCPEVLVKQWPGEDLLPLDLVDRLCSKEPQDELVVRAQVGALEDSLLHMIHGSGRRTVEVMSVRSGQAFTAVLDFRLPVRLTDICIPANPLLLSVSVEVWLEEGEDPVRVLQSKDIASQSVAIGNLSPPPLCQYAKVVFAVDLGKSASVLCMDVGLYCGQPVMNLLAPQVGVKINSLANQAFSLFSSLSTQLSFLLSHFSSFPPLKTDPVGARLIRHAKTLASESGSHQFSISVLQSLCSHFSQPAPPPAEAAVLRPQSLTARGTELLRSPNRWYSIARRLVNKLACLLQSLSEAGREAPSSALTLPQAKTMFHVLGLQFYPKVSARAMAILVQTCRREEWWPELVKDIILEVSCDSKPFFYTKKRAFSLLSGFISRSSSLDMVASILDLLQQSLTASDDGGGPGRPSPLPSANHHWLLVVLYQSLSALSAGGRRGLLDRGRSLAVCRALVGLLTRLLAANAPDSRDTIVVAAKCLLLLTKASRADLRFQDVFSVDSLRCYLEQCCCSPLTEDSLVRAAVDAVPLQIFSEDCEHARKILSNESPSEGWRGTAKEPLKEANPVVNDESRLRSLSKSLTLVEAGGDSDDDMPAYLAKIDDQHYSLLAHRNARRRRITTKRAPSSPGDVDDPPASSYSISPAVDLRLRQCSFQLQAELDLQTLWKENYRRTLKFISGCGGGPPSGPALSTSGVDSPELPLQDCCAEGSSLGPVDIDGACAALVGLREGPGLLGVVVAQLSAAVRQPFSVRSPSHHAHLLWGLLQSSLLVGPQQPAAPPTSAAAVQSLFALLARYPRGLQRLSFLYRLASSSEVLDHVLELVAAHDQDRDVLTHCVKMAVVILSARLELKTRDCGDACQPRVDLQLVATVVQKVFEERESPVAQDDFVQLMTTLCLCYDEEDPGDNEWEGLNMFSLTQSGFLIGMNIVSQTLKTYSWSDQQVLLNPHFLTSLEVLSKFLKASAAPGSPQQREKTLLCMLRHSLLYLDLRQVGKDLFQQFLRLLRRQCCPGEDGGGRRRGNLTVFTQESTQRRGYDERQGWTEVTAGWACPFPALGALGSLLLALVQFEQQTGGAEYGDDPQSTMWEELVEDRDFLSGMLQVYLLLASQKGGGGGDGVVTVLKGLLFAAGEMKLVYPLISAVKWCKEREGSLPALSLLLQELAGLNPATDDLFLSFLLREGMMEAILDGYMTSSHGNVLSPPAPLNLPYVWATGVTSSRDAIQSLSDLVSKTCPATKYVLKSAMHYPRSWRRLAEKQDSEGLTISFTAPVLLHSLQMICPTTNGPVSVEVLVRQTWQSPLLSETGLVSNRTCASLKMEFKKPLFCCELHIQMWKLPSASAIQISGVLLMGQPLQSMTQAEVATPTEGKNVVSHPWLSLLHWWIRQPTQSTRDPITACLQRHSLPLTLSCLDLLPHSTAQQVLMELCALSDPLGRDLLAGCLGLARGAGPGLGGVVQQGGLLAPPPTLDLICALCDPTTDIGQRRLDMALCMLSEAAASGTSLPTHPTLLKALASILWNNNGISLPCLQDQSLFMSLFNCCRQCPEASPHSPATASLLCAACAGQGRQRQVEALLAHVQDCLGPSPSPHLLSLLADVVQSEGAWSAFQRTPLPAVLLGRLVAAVSSLLDSRAALRGPLLQEVGRWLEFFSRVVTLSSLGKVWLGRSLLPGHWSMLVTLASPAPAGEEGRVQQLSFTLLSALSEACLENKRALTDALCATVQGKRPVQFSARHLALLSEVVLTVDLVPVVLTTDCPTSHAPFPAAALPLVPCHQSPLFHPAFTAHGSSYLCWVPAHLEVGALMDLLRDYLHPRPREVTAAPAPLPKVATAPGAAFPKVATLSSHFKPDPGLYEINVPPMEAAEFMEAYVDGMGCPAVLIPSVKLGKRMFRGKEVSGGNKPGAAAAPWHRLALLVEGKHKFSSVEHLRLQELLGLLSRAGFGPCDPPCLHLALCSAAAATTSSSSEPEWEDERLNMLHSLIKHSKRPSPSPLNLSSLRGLRVFLDACREGGLLRSVTALYGPAWPSVGGALRDHPTIAAPPRGIPLHSLAMFGLALSLPDFVAFRVDGESPGTSYAATVSGSSQSVSCCLEAFVLAKLLCGKDLQLVQAELCSPVPGKQDLTTLPYELLERTLAAVRPAPDSLPRQCVALGIFDHLLACLAHLGTYACKDQQQDTRVKNMTMFHPSWSGRESSEASVLQEQEFWAKGTGFGSGSLRSGWNMDQVRERQKKSERQIELIMKVLALIIGGTDTSADVGDKMAATLAASCLLPALASWLTNDSFLDMSLHIPIYLAVFEILRRLGDNPSLVSLLLDNPYPSWSSKPHSATTIFSLMERMHDTSKHFQKASKLTSSNKHAHPKLKPSQHTPDLDMKEKSKDKDKPPAAVLLRSSAQKPPPAPAPGSEADPQQVELLVQSLTSLWDGLSTKVAQLQLQRQQSGDHAPLQATPPLERTAEEEYMERMRPLQFDSYPMVLLEEEEEGKLSLAVPYHYSSKLSGAASIMSKAGALRVTQEITTLATSLPLSASSSVFIRTDEEMLNVMKFMITGPSETPYANGCYVFDVYFPAEYPAGPMLVNLETTGYKTVRFNPNLYADGKVCLSVLNTWSGRPEEKWSPSTSSMLQVLVSIQSLIFVSEPYFNEPGYERHRGTPQGDDQCLLYNAAVIADNMKWAILEQLTNPPKAFKSVVLEHFYLKRSEVLLQCQQWRDLLQEASLRKQHLAVVASKLRIVDSLLPLIRKRLQELKPPPSSARDD